MSRFDYSVRPINGWPGSPTRNRRRSTFKASYSDSEDLLGRELAQIRGKSVVLEIDIRPQDLRLDGTLRVSARPQGPRVILYAETKHGPLMMPCDTFTDWRDNVRAIALSLEALRKVDRYGCAMRGEQYRGWTAIPASTGGGLPTIDAAWALLQKESGVDAETKEGTTARRLYILASKRAHPDVGGSDDRFSAIGKARDLILGSLGE